MTLDQLLGELRQRNIELWLEGDRLRYEGAPAAVTPQVLEWLRQHKADLITFLRTALPPGQAGGPVARATELPLSFAQERLWFLDELEAKSSLYNIPFAFRLTGPLNEDALRQAFTVILERHESLRTNIETVNGSPVRRVRPAGPMELPVVDLTHRPSAQAEAEARRLAAVDGDRPFNLAQDCLVRAQLCRLGATDHFLMVNMHHIASDGWSIGVLFQELTALYEAFVNGRPSPLPALPLTYAEFGAQQREWLQGEVLARELEFWRQRLANAPALLDLPTDRPRPPVQTFHGHTIQVVFPPPLVNGLQELGRREGVSLFMTLLAAFQTLLQRYSRQEDIVVGTPMACRTRTEVEGLIGLFVNTVIMRGDLSGNPSFRTVLGRVRETTLEALAHQELPFEKLVEELQPVRNRAHAPLTQVLFVADNSQLEPVQVAGLHIRPVTTPTPTSKFDLSLYWEVTPAGLVVRAEYNTDLFDMATMQRWMGHYRTLLEAVVAQPETKIAALPLLTSAERTQVLVDWNATAQKYPQHACLPDLFEAQVQRTPAAVAAVCGGATLTYRQLNDAADRLAGHLRECGVGPGRLVGIYVERSLDMLVGLLGILKAGGAYLPLDPNFPAERLAFMIADAQPVVLLTQQKLVTALPAHQAQVVCIDAVPATATPGAAGAKAQATDLAYVLYTSGSTGKPKGVQISQRALVNFLTSMQREPGLTAADVLVAVTTLSFDIAGLELYLPLVTGARVVIASRAVAADGTQLAQLLAETQATVLQATPVTWRLLLAAGWTGNPRLKILCGGEALPAELAEQLVKCSPEVWNLYGPTETTIWSAASRVLPGQPVRVGRPIGNTDFYVLDPQLQPVPVGVPGELLIGGAGVARGYLNRAELTAEKFIANPFRPGERIYRTGDLVRYHPDGTLEFLGRLDQQVKIRGFRIELGEIETVLAQQPAVREAVVVVREDEPGDKRLVAYVTLRQAGELPVGELRGFVKERLPEYMVPAVFVGMEKWPLTPNGKVDRKALPVPVEVELAPVGAELAPRTPVEEQLASIWSTVLRVKTIGSHDSFFALGGHSLLAVQVVSRVRDAFAVAVPLTSVFEYPTVSSLAQQIEKLRHNGAEPAKPAPQAAVILEGDL